MGTKKFILVAVYIVANQLFVSINSYGQEAISQNDIFSVIQADDSDQGSIVLYQDASLHVLVDKYKRMNKNKLKGYRIQLYRGSGQKAREESNLASQEFMSNFPDFNSLQVYALYDTPYFKLRVGDYRTKNEAFEFLYKVKKIFPNAYIVNSRINYPKLKETSDNEQVGDNK